MKILTLTCDYCGAPLEVPAGARSITCSFCSSSLQVCASAGETETEATESRNQREETPEDLETRQLREQLERLDRQWADERSRHMRKGRDGLLHPPGSSKEIDYFGRAVFVVLAASTAISMVMALAGIFMREVGSMTQLLALLVVIASAYFPVHSYVSRGIEARRRAEAYRAAKALYHSRRWKIVRRLARAH